MEEFSHKIEEQEQTIASLEKSNSALQLKIENLHASNEEFKEKCSLLEKELSTAHEEIIRVQDQTATQLSVVERRLQEDFEAQMRKVQEELSDVKYKLLESTQLCS